MATKTISITDEAYGILKERKEDSESFSEVIVRLSGKRRLSAFFGILSKERGVVLEREISESRKRHLRDHLKRIQ